MKNMPYKVRFRHYFTGYNVLLTDWCEKHCQGEFWYEYTKPYIHFEKEGDAVFFALSNRI